MGPLTSSFAAFFILAAVSNARGETVPSLILPGSESKPRSDHAGSSREAGAPPSSVAPAGQQFPAKESSAGHQVASKATAASSMAYTFSLWTTVRLLMEAARTERPHKGRSLAAAKEPGVHESSASHDYQLDLLQLSSSNEATLTREEMWKLEQAKARLKALIGKAESLRRDLKKLNKQIAKEEDKYLIADAAGESRPALDSLRRRIDKLKGHRQQLRMKSSEAEEDLAKVQFDYRQDIYSLQLRAHLYDRGRWLTPLTTQALAAQERINSPNRQFPSDLSKNAASKVHRLLKEQLRVADIMGSRIRLKGLDRQLAREASAVLNDLAYFARELHEAKMYDEVDEVSDKGESLERLVEKAKEQAHLLTP